MDFLKLCFKKNPTERPKAAELLFHPWIQKEQNRLNGMAPPTPTATHSLGSHKKRTTQKHKRMSSSMTMSDLKKMPELPKPSQSTLLPTEPFSRRGSAGTLVSSPTSSLQHRSIFAQKVNQKRAADLRQSMPAEPVHKHKLIEGSFPKGLGKCKVCHTMVKNDALVCKGKKRK